MEKSKWLINQSNPFKLSKKYALSINAIQTEVLKQTESITNFNDFLNSKINVGASIGFTENLTISKLLDEWTDNTFSNGQISSTNNVEVIFSYIILYLYRLFLENKHPLFFTFINYLKCFDDLKNNYLENTINTDYYTFLVSEKNNYTLILKELNKDIYKAIDSKFNGFSQSLQRETERKIDYLDVQIKDELKQDINPQNLQPQQEEILNIDLSDTKLTEQIIMLEKLGVLDYLRSKEPFNNNVYALASVLSGITGKTQRTICSYINPIFKSDCEQKNNPLNKPKTVEKVKQKLISIGYKLF